MFIVRATNGFECYFGDTVQEAINKFEQYETEDFQLYEHKIYEVKEVEVERKFVVKGESN